MIISSVPVLEQADLIDFLGSGENWVQLDIWIDTRTLKPECAPGALWLSLAHVEGRADPIGFHLYETDGPRLISAFTWVTRSWRNADVGIKLWRESIGLQGLREISAVAASRGGWALLQRVKREFPRHQCIFKHVGNFALAVDETDLEAA